MNEKEIKNLIEKYKAGQSTLEEEEILFDNVGNTDPGIEAWSSYVKQAKRKAPANLNDKIWASIQDRKRRKRKLVFGFSLAAAAIALFITVAANNIYKKNMDYKAKAELLDEALSMFSNTAQIESEEKIIYEDEKVVISIVE